MTIRDKIYFWWHCGKAFNSLSAIYHDCLFRWREGRWPDGCCCPHCCSYCHTAYEHPDDGPDGY
jgi:hypothetical protein